MASNNSSELSGPIIHKVKELRVGSNLFASSGVSNVKVTKDGEAHMLEIPIKSTGVGDAIEKFRKNAPVAPTKNEYVTHDSAIGRQMKIAPGQRTWVKVFDTTDPEYVAATEHFNQDMAIETVIFAIAVPILDENGQEVTDRAKKIQALKDLGLSMTQFSQIVEDVQNLTTISEADRVAFFGPNSGSIPINQKN